MLQENITTISLFAEPNVVGMYEKLGFQQNPAGIKAMAFQVDLLQTQIITSYQFLLQKRRILRGMFKI